MSIPDPTPQTPRPAGTWPPPPPPPQRQRLRQRAGLLRMVAAGAVGALLGAGVAVPVTWVAADLVAPAPEASRDEQDVEPWSGDRPGGDVVPGGLAQGRYDAATDAESTGVVLIDTAVGRGTGAGTGWVADSSGLVVTNYHVVAGSSRVEVTDPATDTDYDATVVGHDESADVALLRLAGASADDLPAAPLDDDDDPALGDDVTAVGNPRGQGSLSAADGSVVALDQRITTTDEVTGRTHTLRGLIETDASVVGGFSGGVLLDDEGEVVGMTTAASAGGPAESYAIPLDDALGVVEQIESGDESGSVAIGPNAYLGISVDARAEAPTVAGVEARGPAARAGIEAGDVITAIEGVRVPTFADLERALAEQEPGDRVSVTWRTATGATRTAAVRLGSSPVN